MLNCPNCHTEIPETEIKKHIASKLVEASRNKFGNRYNEEMRRRANRRWINKPHHGNENNKRT